MSRGRLENALAVVARIVRGYPQSSTSPPSKSIFSGDRPTLFKAPTVLLRQY